MRICVVSSNKLMLDCCSAFLLNIDSFSSSMKIDVVTPFKFTFRISRFLELIKVVLFSKQRNFRFNFWHIFRNMHYDLVLTAEPLFPPHIRGDAVIMVGHSLIHLKYHGDELYPYLEKRLEQAKKFFDRVVYLEPNYDTYLKVKKNSAIFSGVIQLVGSPYFDNSAYTKEDFNSNKLDTKDQKNKVLIQSTWSHSLIEENFEFLCNELPKRFPDYSFFYSLHPKHFHGPYSKAKPYGNLINQLSRKVKNLYLVSDDCDKAALINDMDYIISDHNSLVVLSELLKKNSLVFHPSSSCYDSKTLKKVCRNAVHVENQKNLKSNILKFLKKRSRPMQPNKNYNFISDYKLRVNAIFVEIMHLCKKR